MADITITIPNSADVTRALDAFAAVFNRPILVDGVANPESKAAFAKRQVAIWARNIVANYEAEQAAAAARVAAASLNIT